MTMLTLLSAVTSVKDYVDIAHTIMENDPTGSEILTTYFDVGAICTYGFLLLKELVIKIITFGWLPNFAALPSLIPEVTRSMLTELSVLDTPALRFPNMFTFLETPISYGPQNVVAYSLEKFIIGLFNSLFFCLPTSFAHIVCMRRFVMQGVDAGYLAGLGTIAGNLTWISCVILGFRWIVIPWVHLDMLRYSLGAFVVIKYLWDSYMDRRVVLSKRNERNIFLFNFGLAFLEHSMVFPFIGNLAIGSDSTLIESFPTGHVVSFFLVHFCYLGGLLVGSLTMLQGACWFWEEPAFRFYMWAMSTFKMTTLTYYRLCNFFFLYASMVFAMANLFYFGSDYLLTKPLGYLPNDRLLRSDANVLETSYLGSTPSSRNTRMNDGRHTRRERWKRRHKKFRFFDQALYDDGIYDLFTIEDLNYGFHRYWLRRKIRVHKGNYRLLPTKFVTQYKRDQGEKKREGMLSARFEFTRMIFENMYTPTFHQYQTNQEPKKKKTSSNVKPFNVLTGNQVTSAYATDKNIQVTDKLRQNNSALRKFVRKVKLRLKRTDSLALATVQSKNPVYFKRWRSLFSRIYHRQLRRKKSLFQLKSREWMLLGRDTHDELDATIPLSERDRQLLRYKTHIKRDKYVRLNPQIPTREADPPVRALHPVSFYLKREDALKRKFEAYGPSVTRANALGTNLHLFVPLTKRLFFYPKETTRFTLAMQAGRMTRKRTRLPREQEFYFEDEFSKADMIANLESEKERAKANPRELRYTNNYQALISKRALRVRHQIFKDVLQHWYYNPYNRFLIQWDMDSFIRRQPRSYFVNKEDQKQLHLRRVLLNDYFQTFRWYARMDQYHVMKQRIGGTKSFSSRVYNQQFQGTFKKVRHLFAVTPTLETQPILKFDQPLFNEYPNTTKTPVTAQSFIHEELNLETPQAQRLSRDILDQTVTAVALALKNQVDANANYLDYAFDTNETGKATRFLLRGKKNRGIEAASGLRRHLNEEATALKIRTRPFPKVDPRPYVDSLWLSLLDRAADTMFDDEVLKFAIEDFADETYDNDAEHEKLLATKLERLKQWILFMNTTNLQDPQQAKLLGGLTSSSSLAIKDALYFQKDIKRQQVNPRKNRPVYPDRYNQLQTVKKVLKRRYQQRFLDKLKAEKDIYKKTKDIRLLHPQTRGWFTQYVSRPLKTVVSETKERVLTPVFSFVTKPLRALLRAPDDPDFYYWGKREEAYALQEELELDMDPLRRRHPKLDPKRLRELAKKRKEKAYAKKNEYAQFLTNREKQYIDDLPAQLWAEHAEDLKHVRFYSKLVRDQQRSDVNFVMKKLLKEVQDETTGRKMLETATREYEAQFRTEEENREFSPERLKEKRLLAINNRIASLRDSGRVKEADMLRMRRNARLDREEYDQRRYEMLMQRLEKGTLVDPEVPLPVGRRVRIMGDIPWWAPGETPPEGEVFNLKVPLTVYRQFTDSLTKKRDMYDLRRSKRAKRLRQWGRAQARLQAEETTSEETADPEEAPTFLTNMARFFSGIDEIEEEDEANAVALPFEYGTMSLADPNEEFVEEQNVRKLELLQEYTRARKEGDPKAKEMQEKVLRSLTGKPNLKLEDPFEPLTNEPGEFEVEEMNWWGLERFPKFADLEELPFFRSVSVQTEFESVAREAYREAKRKDLRRWWWSEFIPQVRNYRSDALSGRKDREIAKALTRASAKGLLEVRGEDEVETGFEYLRHWPKSVGNRDYKPLQTPQGAAALNAALDRNYENYEDVEIYTNPNPNQSDPLTDVSRSKLEGKLDADAILTDKTPRLVASNPSPFYVGWDETARQFMVTNRYLSREESGYQMNWNDNFPIWSDERTLSSDGGDTMPFSAHPFQGLSANATVYNKVLFASYDADQFFNLGLDGFTPVGWRKFKFRYSAPRVQPLLVHSVETSNLFRIFDTKRPYANLVQRYVTPHLANDRTRSLEKADQGDDLREQFKDTDFIHKHPQMPPYFPHGPLLRDVLPVHYVFSLYQRYRMPKERYTDPFDKQPEETEEVEGEGEENGNRPVKISTRFRESPMQDFTLRKRISPQRMYHRKELPLTAEELLPLPPKGLSGKRPGKVPTDAERVRLLAEANEGRVRTLRRRVLRKTKRPQLRYPPVVGGFVWPGDALHLELVEGQYPQTDEMRKEMKKKALAEGRRVPAIVENPPPLNLPLWSPQAKHIFIATHNKNVLKRRLERTQNKAYAYQKLKFMRLHETDPLVV